jgi:hypothetical protein
VSLPRAKKTTVTPKTGLITPSPSEPG